MSSNGNDNDKTQSVFILTNGTNVLHYNILEKIGAGGMGEIYLADDTKLNRKVALKFMPAHLASDDDMRERFKREAQAVAKLNHPNIVTIHEVSEFNNRPFIVMEHITGSTLYQLSHKKNLPLDTIIDYAIQICQGLGEAHRNGIVHRDIKAANIAIDDSGRIRLLDFGLAAVEGDNKLTKTGSTLGTMEYMSPEQASGREIDFRSDLFSFGIVLYEMIAGQTPFRRDNEGATLKAIIEDNPEPLRRYKSDVPEKMQDIVLKLLEKDKELRYQSAEGVVADLKRLMYDSQQTISKPYSKKDKPKKVIPIAFSVTLILLISIWALFLREGSTEETEDAIPVLIVLPFDNLGAAEDEYFSDGIRSEIGSRLLTVKGLRVISPRSADNYKDTEKESEQIGKETGAEFILEATIRWDKSSDVDRIRITPRLTKATDNYLMWADNYEEKLVDIFAVQSKIANQIVMALGLTLVDTAKSAPEGAPTESMDAYNFYLRGLEISSRSFKLSDFHEAALMFDSAVALDSTFTLAWAQKSINHSTMNFHFTTVDAKHNKEEALTAARKALDLDPMLPDAHIAMGTYYNYIGRDYEKALSHFNTAKSEVTSNADLTESIGIVKMRQGKWEEALALFEDAIRIDPLTDRRYYYIANALSMIRDYDAAGRYITRALVLDPHNPDAAYIRIFINLLQHGKVDFKDNTFDKLVNDAGLAEISTYELSSMTAFGLWRFVIDRIDTREAIDKVRELGNIRGVISERSPHMIHLNLGQIFELTGQKDSALAQYDSTRIILQNVIDRGDAEFHTYAEIGLTYALLGKKELAIEAGKIAKEMMSVDDCHW